MIQGRGKIFYGGRLSKKSAIMVWQRQNISKLHRLKHPKIVPKNETWTRKQMIQNLKFGVYLLISYFFAESFKANKNWQKISLILQYSFAKKTSLILRASQHTQHCKKYTPATQPKSHSL